MLMALRRKIQTDDGDMVPIIVEALSQSVYQ